MSWEKDYREVFRSRLPLTTQFVSMLIWPESENQISIAPFIDSKNWRVQKLKKKCINIFLEISVLFSVQSIVRTDFIFRLINSTQLFSFGSKLPAQFITGKWFQNYARYVYREKKNHICHVLYFFSCVHLFKAYKLLSAIIFFGAIKSQ